MISVQENFKSGPFRIINSQQKLFITKENIEVSIDLTPIEFKIFCHLLRNEEQVVTRSQLTAIAWSEKRKVSDRTVDSHIYTLRQKLGNFAICVQSVHGKGYCFSQSAGQILSAV